MLPVSNPFARPVRILRILRISAVLLLAFIVVGGSSCKKKRKAVPVCDVDTTSCQGVLEDGTSVVFSVGPRPVRSMSNLQFEVKLGSGRPVEGTNVTLDFKMPAMYMGENRVELKAAGDGRYEGKGTIVKCPTGDRLWDAAVIVRRPDQADAILHFRFEVDR